MTDIVKPRLVYHELYNCGKVGLDFESI